VNGVDGVDEVDRRVYSHPFSASRTESLGGIVRRSVVAACGRTVTLSVVLAGTVWVAPDCRSVMIHFLPLSPNSELLMVTVAWNGCWIR